MTTDAQDVAFACRMIANVSSPLQATGFAHAADTIEQLLTLVAEMQRTLIYVRDELERRKADECQAVQTYRAH